MTAASLLSRLAGSARSAWQIARGIVGETAYEQYLEHHRAHHPDTPALGEREFWRAHIDRGDRDPGSRCC
ncbi:putative selenoprotein [Allosaccharopolyspora coralli]|uniref:Putative selenoprotein n=1 Tax=Allosaccharopolyspora coralli TaxID=2665642 RepID=A0A5Q3Q809_9PSEU|nr:YbdD/YjiX family protein [Allosaccharopolyspora coralli]QGK69324.1 putative selenoprotein [Allosaccharopolyspora coralli]